MSDVNTNRPDGSIKREWATAAGAGALFTFLQLFSAWFENIYRMSLVKLEMGAEMAGILLPLLAPLLAWGIARMGTPGLRGAVLGYMAIYAVVWWPPTTPVATIVLAGIGVALMLAIGSHALSGVAAKAVDGTMAIVLATLAYIALRTLGHSLDLYAAGHPLGLLPALGLIPLLRLKTEAPVATVSLPRLGIRAVAIFCIVAFVLLFLSTPGSLSAWNGSNAGLEPSLFAILIAVATYALYGISAVRTRSWISMFATFGFCVCVVAANGIGRLPFPASPGERLVVFLGGAGESSWLYLLAAALSGGLFHNFGLMFKGISGQPPQRVSFVLTLGTYLLVFVSLLLVFSNVWGYVGAISNALRNHFYLPYALCGVTMVIALSLARSPDVRAHKRGSSWLWGLAALLIVMVFIPDTRSGHIDPEGNGTFTVLTYNIQQGSRTDGDQAYAAQCEFIRKVNPDIVALQESDTARPSGGFVNTATYFGRSLGYQAYYGPTTIAGTFGTAILSRYPIRNAKSIYTYSDTDEVGTAVVELEIENNRLRLYNNHPAGSDAVMDAHAAMLVDEVKHGGPVIATGDFNSRPDEAPYKAVAAVLQNAWATLHPDAKGPGFSLETMSDVGEIDMTRRIDHIFYSNDLEVLEAHYVLPPASETDHPAHWARLRFKTSHQNP